MTLSPDTRLGWDEITASIGAGCIGEVYKAKDTRLDRSVAIKVLPSELSADPERRARFEREAKTIAGLNHPHICTLFDVGESGGTTYLVMEYLTGQTLAQRLENGPLPLKWNNNGAEWSPDGRVLALDRLDPNTGWDIWTIAMEQGHPQTPFLNSSFNERSPRFSPD